MPLALEGERVGEVAHMQGHPRIALLQAGEGPAVIFLHGLGATKEVWEPQIAHFSQDYCAIAWDMRGYGGSDDFDGPIRFATDVADDLLRVLTAASVASAHLVGLSMGGFIAQCFYHRYPDRVRSLVLADNFESFPRLLSPERLAGFLNARRDPLLQGSLPSDVAQETAAALLASDADPTARSRFVAILSSMRPAAYIKAMEALAREDSVARPATIRVPTCVLVGEEDRLTPPASCRALADLIQGSEFHAIPRAGHMTNLEQPEMFNRIVRDFLARQA
jgi:3-oxoadipate enol-lactonase